MKPVRALVASLLLLAGCGAFRQLTPADTLGPEEKLEYVILASLQPDAAITYAGCPNHALRHEFLDWFWHQSGFAPAGQIDSLRALYRVRAELARGYFGQADLLNDERVRVYVRHGPARRESYLPEQIRSDTLTVIVQPAEIWSYDSLGMQFDFVKQHTAYRIIGETRYGPNVSKPALEEIDLGRSAPAAQPGALPLGLELALYRLEQRGDSVEVEIHFGLPLNRLAAIKDGERPPVHLALAVAAADGDPVHERGLWVTSNLTPSESDSELAVGRFQTLLPADVYDVALRSVSADGLAASEVTKRLDLLDYVRRAQPGSDVVFYSLVDRTSQGPQFERGDWSRMVPLVTDHVSPGRTFSAMYELYNLDQDESGEHRAEAFYELIHTPTRQAAVIPNPIKHVRGSGTRAVVVERVHTMNLRPGPYLLVARVRDLIADRAINLTARFTITGD